MKKEEYSHNILKIKGLNNHTIETKRIQQNIRLHCYSCVDFDKDVHDEPCKLCFWLDGDKKLYKNKQFVE